MKLFAMDLFSMHYLILSRPCCLHISDPCICIAQVKSDEECLNRVASLGLNKADMNIRTPNSYCEDNI